MTEAEAVKQYQLIKYILKQMNNLRKRDNLSTDMVNAFLAPVNALLCKTLLNSFANKLTVVQAFHNGVNLNDFTPGSLSSEATIQTGQDRNVVARKFQKHIKTIFDDMT